MRSGQDDGGPLPAGLQSHAGGVHRSRQGQGPGKRTVSETCSPSIPLSSLPPGLHGQDAVMDFRIHMLQAAAGKGKPGCVIAVLLPESGEGIVSEGRPRAPAGRAGECGQVREGARSRRALVLGTVTVIRSASVPRSMEGKNPAAAPEPSNPHAGKHVQNSP
jgi:hypothetical protein